MTSGPAQAYRLLLKAYGPRGWWPVTVGRGSDPVYRPGFHGALSERQRTEICVGAILTQNTNWSNVEKSLKALHQAGVWDFDAISRMARPRLAALVRSSGYFRQKAKKLKIFARHVAALGAPLRNWLSKPLPALRHELLSLWGVGPETADSILLYAGARPVFVVDAYTVRIGRRMGWFRRHDYAHVQDYFAERMPAVSHLYAEFHALLVELAKRHCRTTPACRGCPLSGICRHGRGNPASA
jgi:endonuclease-3 related protein